MSDLITSSSSAAHEAHERVCGAFDQQSEADADDRGNQNDRHQEVPDGVMNR